VTEESRTRRRTAAVLAGITLVVFGSQCFWVHRAGAQVPVWDQWFAEFGRVYEPLMRGALPFDALAFVHNEHHLFTSRLISMALFLMSGYWDVKGEMVALAAVRGTEMAILFLLLSPLVAESRRLVLIALVVAVGALPVSPLNVLSGIQAQFRLVEIFSILALAVVVRPLDVERVCGLVVFLLLAFFSMATGIVAMVASAVTILAQGLAGRALPRPRAAVAGLILCLAVFALFITPRYPEYGPPSTWESARILVRCLSFPFPVASGWAILSHIPVAILGFRLLRARAPQDGAWLVIALATWTLMMSLALALGRGATSAPGEQHLEFLALPLIWNYLALERLAETTRPGIASRLVRMSPWLWALAACIFLAGQAWIRGVPRLREMESARPLVEARFRQSLLTHDFRREAAEAAQAEALVRSGDASYLLYDPIGRYTIPLYAVQRLARRDPPLARLFPPEVSGVGRPALFARLLAAAAAAWPFALGIGLSLVFVGLTEPRALAAPPSPARV
jgi:hypothetical protein